MPRAAPRTRSPPSAASPYRPNSDSPVFGSWRGAWAGAAATAAAGGGGGGGGGGGATITGGGATGAAGGLVAVGGAGAGVAVTMTISGGAWLLLSDALTRKRRPAPQLA